MGVFVCLGSFYLFSAFGHLGVKPSVLFAKNSPPDCFLNAQTVLKEIKDYISVISAPTEMVGVFVYNSFEKLTPKDKPSGLLS